MKKKILPILLLTLILTIKGVWSINGGVAVAIGAYPAQVSIHLPNNVICGGTILNANHVLTSAACVLNQNNEIFQLSQVTVRAGSIALVDATPATPVIALFPHPNFISTTRINDVAVIRTSVNFVFNVEIPNPPTAPAVLNQRVLADGLQCQVVGWNLPVGGGVSNLLVLNVPILNRGTCNGANVYAGAVLTNMLCAGGLTAGSGICPSTRGGGLYCNGLLTGIASGGVGCGIANSPGVYTQVRMYQDWINQQLTRTNIPLPGPTPHPGFPVPLTASALHFSTFLLIIPILMIFLGQR